MNQRQLVKCVRGRLDELGITPYQLHQQLNGKVSKQTVYNFLEHGRVIRTDILLLILSLVGMTVCREDERKSTSKKKHT